MKLEELGYFIFMEEQERKQQEETNVENFNDLVREEATQNDNCIINKK